MPPTPLKAILGIAWYRPDQWGRLLEVSSDRDELGKTWDEWRVQVEEAEARLRRSGSAPIRVEVDVEELAAWCRSLGAAVDSASRSNFVTHKLTTRRSGIVSGGR